MFHFLRIRPFPIPKSVEIQMIDLVWIFFFAFGSKILGFHGKKAEEMFTEKFLSLEVGIGNRPRRRYEIQRPIPAKNLSFDRKFLKMG